jgi:hypothetical protein
MRSLLLSAFAALSTPALALEPLPAPGLYCPAGQDVLPILIGPDGGVGVDGMDCRAVVWDGVRVRSRRCYGNGGTPVSYEAELVRLPTGQLLHDGVRFRLYTGQRPCPR